MYVSGHVQSVARTYALISTKSKQYRYFCRAKKIKNQAVVNENPTDRLIRQLKEENAQLMKMLRKQADGKGMSKLKGKVT